MNQETMFKLSYGLYVLSVSEDGKDNGCIVNTVVQAASTPNLVSVCLNKANLTCEMIERAKTFTVSIISRDADFKLFKKFGFVSGRDTNKFEGYEHCKRDICGNLYVTEGTNGYISVKVKKTEDLGSHIMFIGEVEDMEVLTDTPSVTYEYYHSNIKPKPEKKNDGKKIVWRCRICGYEYEGETLPEDFVCPLCKHPASDFEKVTTD